MRRAVLLVGLVVLCTSVGACDRPAPPPSYELRFPFSVPDGTEVVIDGKVVGAFDAQKATFQLPKETTLQGAGTLAARFTTVCGHADRPFTISGDAIESLKRATEGDQKAQTIEVALAMESVPVLTTIWVDPQAEGDVKIGSKVLNKGPNRVLLIDCDDAGRMLEVAGEKRGPVPAYDPKSLDQLFISARVETCYALHTHVYDKGEIVPEKRQSTALAGKAFYELPLVSFFLREAPDEIEVLMGSPTEEKKELARVDCEEKAPADGE